MDISLNMIDLEYLTNPNFLKVKKNVKKNDYSSDIKFYRKRIFQLTKDFLCDKHINDSLKNAFINYANACIDYFKFIDQSEIIQKDYDIDIEQTKKPLTVTYQSQPNHLMMRNVQPISRTITECLPIKYKKKPPRPYMPQNRQINLRDPKFRSKGLVKKNLHNKYGKKPKNKKNEKM